MESGVFAKLHKLRVEVWNEEDGRELVKTSKRNSPVSLYIYIYYNELVGSERWEFTSNTFSTFYEKGSTF